MLQRRLCAPARNRHQPFRQMLNQALRPRRRRLIPPATWRRALTDIIHSAALTAPTNLGTAVRAGCAVCRRTIHWASGPIDNGPKVPVPPARALRPVPPCQRRGCGSTDDRGSPPCPPWRWVAPTQTGNWTCRVGDLRVRAGGSAATRSGVPMSNLASKAKEDPSTLRPTRAAPSTGYAALALARPREVFLSIRSCSPQLSVIVLRRRLLF